MKKLLIGLFVAFLGVNAFAINVKDEAFYTCKSGNCVNGEGTVLEVVTNLHITGKWQNGQSIPGYAYTATFVTNPGKQYSFTYGANGLLDKGEIPLTLGNHLRKPPTFKGSFISVDNRFNRKKVAVFRSGVYNNGTGIEYRGRFEYMAEKNMSNWAIGSGYYIFYGDIIDTEEDTKETGLYVSLGQPDFFPPKFFKATPEYLAQMQEQYQKSLDIAHQEFKDREATKTWMGVFNVIGKIAMIASGVGAGEVILSMVADVMDGADLKTSALKAIGAHVTDPEEEKALTKALDS